MQQLDGGSVASLPVNNTQRVDSDAASLTNDQAERDAGGGSNSTEGESIPERLADGEEAYMLELWEDNSSNCSGSAKSDDMSETFTKKHFNNAEELRDGIAACTHTNEATSSIIGTESSLRRRVLVVTGSPAQYIDVLEKSLDLGVDQRFIGAHILGERYTPTGPSSKRWPRAAGVAFINLQFPEVVNHLSREGIHRRWVDITLSDASSTSTAGIVFQRASLWSNPTLNGMCYLTLASILY